MNQNASHPSAIVQQRSWRGLTLGPVLILLLCAALTACSNTPEKTPEPTVNIGADVLSDKSVVAVQRVDTDSDGKLEWLVFYRFDQVGQQGPVAAMVYDVAAAPGQLPVVFPYKLRTPNQTYLAQGVPKVDMVEVLPETGGTPRKELVFSTPMELAFFCVNGSGVNWPSDDPPLYRCIGFFRSDGGVVFDPNSLQVTVTSRAGYERSQLVTRYYYKAELTPDVEGYFITGTTTLVSPSGSQVDFAGGIPSDVLDTPYPEKTVLAFYRTLGNADAKPTILDYLTAQAATDLLGGKLKLGSPFPLDQIKFATVKELSYYPTQEDTSATQVNVKVVFTSAANKKSPLTEVHWRLIRDQNRWKMDITQP